MNCRYVRDRLVALQDDELPESTKRAVAAHLAVCTLCRGLERRLGRATPRPFATLPPALEHKLWADLDRAVAVELANPPVARSLADRLPPAGFAAAGYLALLLVVFAWGLHNWSEARDLEARIGARPVAIGAVARNAGPLVTIPSGEYRPASWSPTEPR